MNSRAPRCNLSRRVFLSHFRGKHPSFVFLWQLSPPPFLDLHWACDAHTTHDPHLSLAKKISTKSLALIPVLTHFSSSLLHVRALPHCFQHGLKKCRKYLKDYKLQKCPENAINFLSECRGSGEILFLDLGIRQNASQEFCSCPRFDIRTRQIRFLSPMRAEVQKGGLYL